jgi:uncharacterized protein YkwD
MSFSDSKSIENARMLSPTHRSNILDATYTKVGIGIAHGTYQGALTTFVVQFFATPAKSSAQKTS